MGFDGSFFLFLFFFSLFFSFPNFGTQTVRTSSIAYHFILFYSCAFLRAATSSSWFEWIIIHTQAISSSLSSADGLLLIFFSCSSILFFSLFFFPLRTLTHHSFKPTTVRKPPSRLLYLFETHLTHASKLFSQYHIFKLSLIAIYSSLLVHVVDIITMFSSVCLASSWPFLAFCFSFRVYHFRSNLMAMTTYLDLVLIDLTAFGQFI